MGIYGTMNQVKYTSSLTTTGTHTKAKSIEHSRHQHYEAAIRQLNDLQSNAQTIQQIVRTGNFENLRFQNMIKYMRRTGLLVENLDALNIIHVSGTKGKGSVCSYVESILREHGLKTGFFSSPHLVSVTERIRINGVPIAEQRFADYFWSLHAMLNVAKDSDTDMPAYFTFLTIMAFHVFLKEKVDVAVIEVGIGGEYDCTNIISRSKVVGITSLGLDHVNILGDTINKIAWQKAGIIKHKSHVFTVPQLEDGNKVIEERAKEKEASLTIVPEFKEYSWDLPPNLRIQNQVQWTNISLAVQISLDWLEQMNMLDKPYESRLQCSEKVSSGIEKCSWPGRYQTIVRDNVRFLLDGAHTVESLRVCAEWYVNNTNGQQDTSKGLVIFITGQRNVKNLLQPVLELCHFDLIVISPNVLSSDKQSVDNASVATTNDDNLQKCLKIKEAFEELMAETGLEETPVRLAANVEEAFQQFNNSAQSYDVLVTGSLYLVGTALMALNTV